jgi:signal transduction histidine kinase
MKLLIAHENKANLGLLRAVLEDEGFTVVEAMDVAQGLKLLKEHGPDAIISDLPFPKVAGYRTREDDHKTKERRRSFAPTIMAALRLAPRRFNRVLRGRAARRRLRQADGDSAVVVRKVEETSGDFERLRKALERANEEIEQHVKERTWDLERANKELQAFNHSVAHDLRNPLFGIMSSAQCLDLKYGNMLDADGRELLGYIRSSGNRMSAIITNLLKLSEITHSTLRREACDLSELAAQIGARLQQAHPEHPVEFTVERAVTATADLHLLTPALENLLGNAWKYTGKTRGAQVQFGWEWKAGQAIYFVRDNGAGFDLSKADNLFKPFVRLHSPSEFPGSGIGLSIAHRAIERHGGELWAESTPGHGTTFFFRL